jgi:FKBP-type peptidyl-prolyl cis-trans isomerase
MRSHLWISRRAFVLALPLLFAAACGGDETTITDPPPPAGLFPSNPAEDTFAASLGVNLAGMTKLSNNLYIQDITVGTGAVATSSSTVGVIYTGWFTNGSVFDSNVGGSTLAFPLSSVIAGWQQGIPGMKVGGKRRLVIGSALAYGSAGSPPKVPANVTLIFDVQLVGLP